VPTFKWLFLNNLRSKTLGQIQNLDPHRLMSRLKSKTLQATQMLELQGFAVEHNCRLVLTGDTKQHHSVQRGDALRILERWGVIAQALLTKIYRQGISELREAIGDLSKGGQEKGSTSWQVWSHSQGSCSRRNPRKAI
jgi:hypothetical protein